MITRSKPLVKSTTNKDSASDTRSWSAAAIFSAIAIITVMTIAVSVNLAIGRIIHWEIVIVLGVIGFVFLTIGRKFKTI